MEVPYRTEISANKDLETSEFLPVEYLRILTYIHKPVEIFQDYIFKKYSEHRTKDSVII